MPEPQPHQATRAVGASVYMLLGAPMPTGDRPTSRTSPRQLAGTIDPRHERCKNAAGHSFRGHRALQCRSGRPCRPATGPPAVPVHLRPRTTIASEPHPTALRTSGVAFLCSARVHGTPNSLNP